MSNTAVLTLSSRDPVEPYYFLNQFKESARRVGISPIFLNERVYAGLMTKPKSLKTWIEREGAKYDYICMTDAWDIIWVEPIEEIVGEYQSFFRVPIVFNAERNCFPRADLEDKHPTTTSPYRFLNSGFFIGETGAVLQMLREMDLDHVPDDKLPDGTVVNTNDQAIYMAWYVDHQESATLDVYAKLCQSLHGSGPDEFVLDGSRVLSHVTGEYPCVFHGNGGGKDWLKTIMRWMKMI